MTLRIAFYTAIVVLAGTIYGLGYSAGADKALASATSRQLKSEEASAQLLGERLRRHQAEAKAAADENQRLELALGEARKQSRVVYRTIRQEVPHAVSEIIPLQKPGASSTAPGVCDASFGPGFVRVWDAASDPERADLSSSAGFAVGAAAEAVSAGRVDGKALLDNHIDNAELATEARGQLEALIDWHLEHDGGVP
ncbi:hypothetical protein ED208_12525 [Stagnimonas aquatica]|uniref:Lysis protein n=1 Tax=Stagnimonas aquatica TaxID=2689987 RepID=A0A3N0V770_9GAMM|nr:hypothetical protein [Stagnimonas aquatica]ROH88637.1 hypothetical protein ED208_12525 [Stagnimonas aquatica]